MCVGEPIVYAVFVNDMRGFNVRLKSVFSMLWTWNCEMDWNVSRATRMGIFTDYRPAWLYGHRLYGSVFGAVAAAPGMLPGMC